MAETERIVPQLWAELILKSYEPQAYRKTLEKFLGHPIEPPKPLSRWERFRRRQRRKLDDAREQIALKIAPWLDHDPYA